jgi:hypothetical protein
MDKAVRFNIIFLLVIVLCSCCKRQSTITPNEYLYCNKVTPALYSKDSTYINEVLYGMLVNNIPPFTSKSFDSTSIVFIDTLIYGPDYKRLALWVITKNSNSKLLNSTNNRYQYNGNCMYASRPDTSSKWRVHERSFFNVTFFKNPVEVKEELSLYSFRFKATFKRTDSISTYNINDIRFWTEITWDESILSTPSH